MLCIVADVETGPALLCVVRAKHDVMRRAAYVTMLNARRRLAVALPQHVAIYELPAGAADSQMAYRLLASIPCNAECSCLALLPGSVAICQVAVLAKYDAPRAFLVKL